MAEFTPMQGNVHGDTKAFNDAEALGILPDNARIVFIRVWHSDFIHGIRVDYVVNGELKKAKNVGDNARGKTTDDLKLKQGDFINYFEVRSGNIIDGLTIRTNSGEEIVCGGTGGGDPAVFEIPEGQTIGALAGGTNGDLHNISLMFSPIFKQQKLPLVGAYHGDTEMFDDIEFLMANPTAKIKSIKGCFDSNVFHGLVVKYDVDGEEVQAEPHFSNNASSGIYTVLELDDDEVIKNVTGRAGSVIHRLRIITNKNKEFVWGVPDVEGLNQFNYKLGQHRNIRGFYGGFKGEFHNLGIYCD